MSITLSFHLIHFDASFPLLSRNSFVDEFSQYENTSDSSNGVTNLIRLNLRIIIFVL